jgi:hypothetical protein
MRNMLKKKYEGLSLVETLLTIVIITTVMLLASVTLTTLIKASAVSAARTTAREESEFVLELLRRTIRNSHNDDIYLYSVSGRAFDEGDGEVVGDGGPVSGYEVALNEGQLGNEIHFRPTGFDRWVCLGFFPGLEDPDRGYLLKSSTLSLSDPASCFDSSADTYKQNTIVLNSDSIDVNLFQMQYYLTQGSNVLMTIDVEVEPTNWSENFTGPITPTYFKQAVVSTQKLDWE